jgi:hypothetical protein
MRLQRGFAGKNSAKEKIDRKEVRKWAINSGGL